MKLNSKCQLGMGFTESMRNFIYTNQMRKVNTVKDDSDRKMFEDDIKDIISDNNNKNYVFTQSAMAITDKIIVNRFEPMFLNLEKKTNKKITILVNDKLFYRFSINNRFIFCMIGEIKNSPMQSMFSNIPPSSETIQHFYYTTFRIVPSINQINFPDEMNFADEKFNDFLRRLIFLEFSDTVDKIILKPNGKIGTRKKERLKNETNKSIVVIDSTWNVFIKVLGKFTVSGHFRLQPYGEGRKQKKLKYIDTFTKEGYSRTAKKETV